MVKSKVNKHYGELQMNDYYLQDRAFRLHSHYIHMDRSLLGKFEDGDTYFIQEGEMHAEHQPVKSPKPFGKY